MEAFILRWPEPNDFNHERMTVLLRVDTKEGISGWGEAIAMWPEACRATKTIIEDGFAPLLAGHDAGDVVALESDEGAQLVVRRRRHRGARDFRGRHGALGHRRQGGGRAAGRAFRRTRARRASGLRQPARQPPDDRGQRRRHQGLHRRRVPFGEARARQSAVSQKPAAIRITTWRWSVRCARRSARRRTSWSTPETACAGTSRPRSRRRAGWRNSRSNGSRSRCIPRTSPVTRR